MKISLRFISIVLLALPGAVYGQTTHFLQVHFGSNSAKLSSESLRRIDSLVQAATKYSTNYKVVITGHADSSGGSQHNQGIAKKRAQACEAVFLQKGCSKKHTAVISKGSKQAIYSNATEFGRAVNRRADIVLTELPPEAPIRKVDRLSEVLDQQQYRVSVEKGAKLKYTSGTELVIPANGFVDANGKIVKGKVDISYVEMRDAIDIALSDVEMTHAHGDELDLFNSGGMFRILASQKGKAVYVNNDSAIRINFAMAQKIPNLNFYTYDSITRKWTEQKKLTDQSGKSLRKTSYDYYRSEFTDYRSKCNLPYFEGYLYKVNTGISMASGKKSLYDRIMEIDTVGALRALARSDSAQDVVRSTEQKIAALKSRQLNEKHFYRVQILDKNDSSFSFRIFCKGRSYNEFENFDKVFWKYTASDAKELEKLLHAAVFTTCEIVPETGVCTLQLTTPTQSLNLSKVELLCGKEIHRADRTTYAQALLKQFDTRQENYVQLLENLKNEEEDLSREVLTFRYAAEKLYAAKERFNWYYQRIKSDSIYCFWAEHLDIMSPPERSMRFENWLQFYDKHYQQYMGHYLREKKSAKFKYFSKLDWQYRNYLAMVAEETKASSERNELVESLQIRQLGLCNIDALVRYNFKNQALIAFKDVTGKAIDVQNVKLIDASINSAVNFQIKESLNEIKVFYNPQGETALLVFDADGKLYVCGKSSFARESAADADEHMELMASLVNDKKDKAKIRTLMQ